MAIMVPNTCPSSAQQGEKGVFALLKESLPDHFSGWYEPRIRGRYPDFTLLANDFGLLLLEVKDWYCGKISKASNDLIEYHKTEDGQPSVLSLQNPILQARGYFRDASRELSRNEFAILRQNAGKYQGKVCFPIGYGVIFTNITRAQLDEHGLSTIFPPERVICRNELRDLARASSGGEVANRLKLLFEAPFPFEKLSEDQVKTIRGAIHPEVVVKRRPATEASVAPGERFPPDAIAYDVLDADQEQLARSIETGHHVLYGIAGSGKTTILLSRARAIARHDPSLRILLLCFNKPLAVWLASHFKDEPELRNIEVRTFHAWASLKLRLWCPRDESYNDFEPRLVETMVSRIDSWPESEKYDAILIDEAQDFEPDWFRCVTSLLKGGAEGNLLIASDGAQSVYLRDRSFTWKAVGVSAVGRTRWLSRCYRNTKPILQFAWEVCQKKALSSEESEVHQQVTPKKVEKVGGSKPLYHRCESIDEEHALVAKMVAHYRSLGVPTQEIGVLYRHNDRGRAHRLCDRLRQEHNVAWISEKKDRNGGVESLASAGIRLSTIKTVKGLEFSVVIVVAADLIGQDDLNLLYVGLTRATTHLVVSWVGSNELTDRIIHSNWSIAWNDEAALP